MNDQTAQRVRALFDEACRLAAWVDNGETEEEQIERSAAARAPLDALAAAMMALTRNKEMNTANTNEETIDILWHNYQACLAALPGRRARFTLINVIYALRDQGELTDGQAENLALHAEELEMSETGNNTLFIRTLKAEVPKQRRWKEEVE